MDSNSFDNTASTNTSNTQNSPPAPRNKPGPNPSRQTDPGTGRTDDQLGPNEQQSFDPHRAGTTGTGPGIVPDSNECNVDKPSSRGRASNIQGSTTATRGDNAGLNPRSADHVTDRTDDENIGRHDQQATGHTGSTDTHPTDTLTGTHTGTHTEDPVTRNKTGTNAPAGTNAAGDGNLGHHDQQPTGYTDATNVRTGTDANRAQAGGAGRTSGTNTHTAYNPSTGDNDINTYHPVADEKADLHPPASTGPSTDRTNGGNLGRGGQQPGAYTDVTGTTGTDAHDDTVHDTTRDTDMHSADAGTAGSGPHPTTKASGGGTKATLGRAQATLGAMIDNSEMHAKGVRKQEEAKAAKRAQQETTHGGINVRH